MKISTVIAGVAIMAMLVSYANAAQVRVSSVAKLLALELDKEICQCTFVQV